MYKDSKILRTVYEDEVGELEGMARRYVFFVWFFDTGDKIECERLFVFIIITLLKY